MKKVKKVDTWHLWAVVLFIGAGVSGRTLRERAQGHWQAGRREEAIQVYTEAIEAYQKEGDQGGAAYCYYGRGTARRSSGKNQEADVDFRESAQIFRRAIAAAPDPGRARRLENEYANVLYGLGEAAKRAGDIPEARRIAQERLDIYRKFEDPGGQAVSEDSLGELDLAEGRYAEAKARFEASYNYYKVAGNPYGIKAARERAEKAALLAQEGPASAARAREDLKLLRERVSRFYSEFGRFPATLEELEGVGAAISDPGVAEHRPARGRGVFPGFEASSEKERAVRDSGNWGYDPSSGLVFIDCRHPSADGRPYYAW